MGIRRHAISSGQTRLSTNRLACSSLITSSSHGRRRDSNPNLADAHLAQGRILELVDFNFAAAEVEFRRAFELSPQNAAVTANLADLLAVLGRLDEAVALGQRAIRSEEHTSELQSQSNLVC